MLGLVGELNGTESGGICFTGALTMPNSIGYR